MSLSITHIQDFILSVQRVYASGQATEHSYRPALEILLRAINPDLEVVNEPKRQKVGAPDFIVYRGGVQVAFVEAKDIPEKLADKKHINQLERYKALGNLCFSNNLQWQFFVDSQLATTVIIANLVDGKIVPLPENYTQLVNYLNEFVSRHGVTIRSAKQLATVMAGKARSMREILIGILEADEETNQKSQVYREYETFRSVLIHDLTIAKFADLYSQTITYGLFTARYYDKSLNNFSRQEAANTLPKSNPFLRKLFQNIAG